VLGGTWTIVIIWQPIRRTTRFNELKKAIPGITQTMLTSHLRDLEVDGIVVRTVYAEVPPRVDYALTDHGRSLEPVIRSLECFRETCAAVFPKVARQYIELGSFRDSIDTGTTLAFTKPRPATGGALDAAEPGVLSPRP
jgi:DNA-binding HxlR family transcriptional regulator